MSQKVQRFERGKQIVTDTAHAQLTQSQDQERLLDATELLGAVRVTQSIGRALSAQSFRALQQFADLKGHETFGFERFDDFLNNSPRSPMTKHEFYNRLALIESEGDQTFDVLNGLRIPVSKRKLLGTGMVKVEGETLYIGQDDDEIAVPISDRNRVVEVITALARDNARQAVKIEKGEKQNLKLKKERDEIKNQPGSLTGLSPFDQALLNLLGAFHALSAEAERLSPEHQLAKRDSTFRRIADQRPRLEEAFGFDGHKVSREDRDLLSDKEVEELGDLM